MHCALIGPSKTNLSPVHVFSASPITVSPQTVLTLANAVLQAALLAAERHFWSAAVSPFGQSLQASKRQSNHCW